MVKKKKDGEKTNSALLIAGGREPELKALIPVLEKVGLDLETAHPGDKNLKQKITHSWNALLISSRLAGMIPKIRELRGLRQLPILLVYPRPGRERDANLLRGADDFIHLPITASELKLRLQGLLERSRTHLEEYPLSQGYQALKKILSSVQSGKSDAQILQLALGEMNRMFPYSSCSIMMIDQARQRGIVVVETEKKGELNITLNLKKYPEILKVIKTKKPLVIADVQRHPVMKEVKNILAAKFIHSILVVPVIYQEELIGAMILRSLAQNFGYLPSDIYFARMIADALAVSLKNIRLSRLAQAGEKEKTRALESVRREGLASRRLEKLFEYASDGLILANKQGKITGVNQNFVRLTGFDRAQVVGEALEKFLALENPRAEPVREWIGKKHRSGTSHFLLKVREGAGKYVTVHIEPLPGPAKELLISVHDVSEERKLSLELRRTKEFLENLVQNSLQAIIVADMDGNIIIFNRAAEDLTGLKATEVVGKRNIVDLYAPGSARATMKKLRSQFYGGVGRLETTHNVILNSKGEEVPINMNAAIIYDDRGKEIATVGLYQDLRERIEIEKRLRQAQERLLESKRREAVMALAGAAAHELNQPLTSVMGYTEILKRLAEQVKEKSGLPENMLSTCANAIKMIDEQAERMAETIKKLGELSEVETKEYAGKQKILDLERTGAKDRNFSQMLAMMEEAALVMDSELLILEAFGQARKIFGENPEGRSLSRYFEGVNYARAVELVERAKNQGRAGEELILRSAQGKNQRVKLSIERGGDKDLILSIADIGARREMEAEHQELSAFREELFQNLPVPLLLLDQDGKITYLTRETERMFGYSTEELKGELPGVLLEDFDPNLFLRMLRTLRAEGKLEGKAWVKDRQGKSFLAYYFNRVMRDRSGEAIGFLFFLVDLSERHLLEQALKEKTNFLEAIQNNTEILIRASDWQEALASMLMQLGKLLDFDIAGITPMEATERGLYFLTFEPKTKLRQFREIKIYEKMEEVLNWMSAPGIVYLEDFSQYDFGGEAPGDFKEIKEDLLKRGIKSFLAIPLKFQDELVGRLFLGHRQPGYLKPEKLEPISQLIDQIAIALSHFRLYLKLEKQKQALLQRNIFLEQIIEQSQKIDLQQDESKIFGQFLTLFQQIFPRAHLWIAWRGEEKELLLKGVSNLDSGLIGSRLDLKPGLEAQFLESAHPLAFEPGLASLGFLENSRSVLLVPIVSERNLIGLLGVESHHREPFLSEEQFLLQLFSRYLAIIIPNLLRIRQAALFSKLQEILIENASVFIVMYDQAGKISLINRTTAERLGKKREELMGMDIQEFMGKYVVKIEDPQGRGIGFTEIMNNVSKGERVVNSRVKFRSASGEIVEALSNTDPLMDQHGNLRGIVTIGQDLAPLKQLEERLHHSERLAGIGQMAAGVAHELNNPLQAIITSSEMVQRRLEELKEKDLARRLETVIQASERIQRLARNLMGYARPGVETTQEIEVKKLVDELLSFSGYELRRGGVKIENLVPENLPRLKVVKDQIEQVLINLLTNASYACAEKGGGKIRIKARTRGNWLELRVEDTGVGIEPQDLSRVFDPFFTTKPREKGSGLGLNIVQSIVERHRGKIKVKSKPGEGTVFFISFPLAEAGPA